MYTSRDEVNWGKDFLVRERGTFAVCMQADERGLVRERSLVRAIETYARRHAPHDTPSAGTRT